MLEVCLSFDGGSRGNPGSAGAGAEVYVRYLQPSNDDGKNVASENDASGNILWEVRRSRKYRHREYLGLKQTNNQAEYRGVICGLRQIFDELVSFTKENSLVPEACQVNLVVQGDSKLVIEQLKGGYQCNSAKLKPLHKQCNTLISRINSLARLTIHFEHIYRQENQVADGK